MKKLFALIALCSVFAVTLMSCSKDEDESAKSSLKGTKWTTSYSDYLMVLEFVSDSQVQGYFARPDGTYYSGQITGSYSMSGNNVTFTNMTYRWIYAYYKLKTGTVNGSFLHTKGEETWNIDKGNWSSWNETWNKR